MQQAANFLAYALMLLIRQAAAIVHVDSSSCDSCNVTLLKLERTVASTTIAQMPC